MRRPKPLATLDLEIEGLGFGMSRVDHNRAYVTAELERGRAWGEVGSLR